MGSESGPSSVSVDTWPPHGDSGSDAVIAVAVALEFLHTCALIHDDVMDDSSWRRGVPTAHVRHAADHRTNQWQGESRRFGEGVAILAGDLALIYADDFMSEAGPVVAEAWAELRAELIIGQHLDLVAAARFTSDPSLSRIIARVKSGNYTISRPLVLGALTAGRADLQQIFLEYGQAIGEAFQLRDDLLDLISDTKILGKPARLDFEQHKMTLLLSLAIARDPEVAALVTTPDGSAERLRTTLLDSGICDEVETQISDLVATGTKVITDADLDPEWRDELIEMAHAVAYRDK